MLENKKKSKGIKKKEKDKEKDKEKKIKEEEYKKYRCQAITYEGKQCLRKSDIILDLREGIRVNGLKVIPEIDCCLFCKQHFKIKASEFTTRLLFESSSSKRSQRFCSVTCLLVVIKASIFIFLLFANSIT